MIVSKGSASAESHLFLDHVHRVIGRLAINELTSSNFIFLLISLGRTPGAEGALDIKSALPFLDWGEELEAEEKEWEFHQPSEAELGLEPGSPGSQLGDFLIERTQRSGRL